MVRKPNPYIHKPLNRKPTQSMSLLDLKSWLLSPVNHRALQDEAAVQYGLWVHLPSSLIIRLVKVYVACVAGENIAEIMGRIMVDRSYTQLVACFFLKEKSWVTFERSSFSLSRPTFDTCPDLHLPIGCIL